MIRRLLGASAAVFCTLVAGVAPSIAPADAPPLDLNAVAKSVVQIAQIKENQIVVLTSDPANFSFLEDLAVAVRAQGAFPLIWVTSDKLNQRLYSEVPAKYDSQAPLLQMNLYKMADAWIQVDYGGDQDFSFYASADQNRLAAQAKAGAPSTQIFLSSNRRFVDVGNGIFPNPPNAALFGVSQTALADTFWTAVNADPTKIQANADALQSAIAHGGTMRVTNPNGTDISFGITNARSIVSAGSIRPDCTGIHCFAALPAGDLYIMPLPGTATGKIVIDNTFWGKDDLKGFTATFSAGKRVAMTSSSDMTKINAAYAAGGDGRDQFSLVDLGVNDGAKNIPGSLMLASFAGGSVSLGFGGDAGLGGTNSSAFSFFGTQPGCTVTVDGETVVANGSIVAQ